MKYNGPKAKKCRRYGANIYGSMKYDKAMERRETPGGRGGSGGRGSGGRGGRPGKKSEYAQQLLEKQKARDIYCLSEKQFRRLYKEAAEEAGHTGDVLKQLLEQRLDNVVFRAGFALTRPQARQIVGHGHFYVDGRRVTVPSFRVAPGHVITLRPQLKSSPLYPGVAEQRQKYMPPKWLKVDSGAMRIEIVTAPEASDGEQALDVRQIVEFYSRT